MATNEQITIISSFTTKYAGEFMCVFGTIGNLTNILVFCCLKTYRSLPTSAFLATSSIAGQFYIASTIFLPFLSNFLGYNLAARNSSFCKLIIFSIGVSVQISLTCLCLSSIERYLMTSRSLHFRTFITMLRALLAICLSTFLWLCYGIPSAIYTINILFSSTCNPHIGFFRILTYLNLFFAILLPVCIMSVFGLLTWKNLERMQNSPLNIQVAKMILLDVAIVAISNIPSGCLYLYDIAVDVAQLFTLTILLIFNVVQLVGAIQSCGSFYFYLWISPTFRRNIIRMISKICCFSKRTVRYRITPQDNVGVETVARIYESTL